MHPIFHILGRDIPGYGLMGVCGFAVCTLLLLWGCRRYRFTFDDAMYVFVWSLVGTMAGAKILFTFVSFPELYALAVSGQYTLYELVYIYLRGGMVFYGGLLGAVIGAFASARYFRIPTERWSPVMVPAVPLFAGFGRLGCLTAGCCYGRETTSPLHIVFTESDYAPNGVPLVPTQLYEALFDFVLCAVLVHLAGKERFRPHLLRIYLAAYAVFRFILEFYRGDAVRGVFILSTSQWISLAVLVFVIWRVRTHPVQMPAQAAE